SEGCRKVPFGEHCQDLPDGWHSVRACFGPRPSQANPTWVATGQVPTTTLVENSFKHVVSLSGNGGKIHIEGKAVDDKVNIEVRDNGAGFNSEAIPVGHGLDNLPMRLALFDKEAAMDISRKGGFTVVSVSLPKRQP